MEQGQQRATKTVRAGAHVPCTEAEGTGLVQPGEGKVSGGLRAASQYLCLVLLLLQAVLSPAVLTSRLDFLDRRNLTRYRSSSDDHWRVNRSCCYHQGCPAPVLRSPSAPGSSSHAEQPRPSFAATRGPRVLADLLRRSGPTSGRLKPYLCPEGCLASLPGRPGFATTHCLGVHGQRRSGHAF